MEKVQKILLTIAIILLPLFFWSGFLFAFETSKIIFISLLALAALTICAIKIAIKGSLNFKFSTFSTTVILLAVAYIASSLIRTPNKVDAFFVPGSALLIILGTVYFLLAGNHFAENKKLLISSIFVSAVLVSVASLLFATGIFAKIPGAAAYLNNPVFSVIGGKLPEAIFLVLTLPLGLSLLLKGGDFVKKVFWGISLAVVSLSVVLSIYNLLPGKKAEVRLPSFQTSWAVAIDTLKVSPFFGVGPGNYITAYNRFKPVSENLSKTWNLSFSTSRSYLLTALTETGIIGFAILIFLLYQIYRLIEKNVSKTLLSSPMDAGIFASLALASISLIFFPLYLTTIVPLMLLLSAVSSKKEVNINLKTVSESKVAARIPAIALSVIILGLVSTALVYGFKLSSAEYSYTKAIASINKGDNKTAYSMLVKAININPKSDRYHLSLSQMDIALVSIFVKSKNLTENDKNTITQLIQQAIAEAKNAVALNPQKVANWENLARVYRSIMPFADNAGNFATQTYTQAIALSPIDPNLRINLGGVYYALGMYDEALNAFQMAVAAKNNFANAHYNLAAVLRQKNQISKAVDEMNIVLSLVEKDSEDYKIAQAELENLKKQLPIKGTNETENLNLPEKQEQVIKPPLELPEEANPPEAQPVTQ